MGNCVCSKNETVLNEIVQLGNSHNQTNQSDQKQQLKLGAELNKNSFIEKNLTFHSSSDAYTETQKNVNHFKFERNSNDQEYELASNQFHENGESILF